MTMMIIVMIMKVSWNTPTYLLCCGDQYHPVYSYSDIAAASPGTPHNVSGNIVCPG
jgi:hypothetical protein